VKQFALAVAAFLAFSYLASPRVLAVEASAVGCALTPAQSDTFANGHGHKLHVRFYGAGETWLADELVENAGTTSRIETVFPTIQTIATLFDPELVKSVSCTFDEETMPSLRGAGAMRVDCPAGNGLNIEGGPDESLISALVGKDWALARMDFSIAHFLGHHGKDLVGEPYGIAIDDAPMQRVVVSGTDPQEASFLFVQLRPGMHRLDYGPIAFGQGVADELYHYCFVLNP
jgi:hypothetical protein